MTTSVYTSLADLITLTRERSNMESNYFVTDDELTTYINNSLCELDDEITIKYEDYRLNNFIAVLPTLNNTNIIAIPSDMNKLRGVDYQMQAATSAQGARWGSLQLFMFTERNRQNNDLVNVTNPVGRLRLTYRLVDQGIMIEPQTQANGTYQVWYTPKFNRLLTPTDILPIQLDTQAWSEYAVVDCCIKIFNKQNLDPSGFMAEKAALKQRITAACRNRDSAGPKRIANVRYNNGDSLGYPYFDSW